MFFSSNYVLACAWPLFETDQGYDLANDCRTDSTSVWFWLIALSRVNTITHVNMWKRLGATLCYLMSELSLSVLCHSCVMNIKSVA